jgi:hypothetical protein
LEKEQKITNITIEYKNDVNKTNNLIEFLIDLLLDNNELAGEEFGKQYDTRGIGEDKETNDIHS